MTKHQQTCMSIPMSNDIMLLHLYYLFLFFIPFVFLRNSRNLSDACNWARKFMQCVYASYLFIKMGWREEFDFEIPCFSPCFSLLALIRTQFWTLKMIFNKSKVGNVILETIKALTPAVISPFPVLLRLKHCCFTPNSQSRQEKNLWFFTFVVYLTPQETTSHAMRSTRGNC